MKNLSGTGVALITPFKDDLSVDYDALKKLVRFQIENGINFLVVMGTTGENPTLTAEEKNKVLTTILEENNGQLPVVYGVGGYNTMAIVETLKNVPKSVDAILSVAPYYNKPTQEGLYQHFKTIAESTDFPIILYNVPGRTSSNIQAETVIRLSAIKNIIGVKEASGNMGQIMDILHHKPTDFKVFSGDDALTLPMIACGATGVVSVVGQAYPEKFTKMVNAALKNDYETARHYHYDLLQVTHYFFQEGNPAGVKVALEKREICKNTLRLPLVKVSSELQAKIVAETERICK